MSEQLAKKLDLYAFNSAGSTGVTSLAVEIDTDNCEGVLFLGTAGTTSTAATLTISTAASTTASFVALSGGTAASTGAGAFVAVDVHKPLKRWLKGTLSTTANARLSVQAFKYGNRKCPVTWTSTGILTSLVSPNT